jgi:hypothetical protein
VEIRLPITGEPDAQSAGPWPACLMDCCRVMGMPWCSAVVMVTAVSLCPSAGVPVERRRPSSSTGYYSSKGIGICEHPVRMVREAGGIAAAGHMDTCVSVECRIMCVCACCARVHVRCRWRGRHTSRSSCRHVHIDPCMCFRSLMSQLRCSSLASYEYSRERAEEVHRCAYCISRLLGDRKGS